MVEEASRAIVGNKRRPHDALDLAPEIVAGVERFRRDPFGDNDQQRDQYINGQDACDYHSPDIQRIIGAFDVDDRAQRQHRRNAHDATVRRRERWSCGARLTKANRIAAVMNAAVAR